MDTLIYTKGVLEKTMVVILQTLRVKVVDRPETCELPFHSSISSYRIRRRGIVEYVDGVSRTPWETTRGVF